MAVPFCRNNKNIVESCVCFVEITRNTKICFRKLFSADKTFVTLHDKSEYPVKCFIQIILRVIVLFVVLSSGYFNLCTIFIPGTEHPTAGTIQTSTTGQRQRDNTHKHLTYNRYQSH